MIRLFDLIFSFFLILLTLPLFILIAVIIRLNGRSGVFYCTIRIGRHGRPYKHFKFRTMRPGRETGRVFFEQGRITRSGRLLRRTHLDELPELWLILFGTMAFVGPRPLPARLLEGLDTAIRKQVRPGWTGPAQILLLRKGTLNKRLQIRLDNLFVRKRNLRYVLRLLGATVRGVFSRHPKPDLSPDSTKDRQRFRKQHHLP